MTPTLLYKDGMRVKAGGNREPEPTSERRNRASIHSSIHGEPDENGQNAVAEMFSYSDVAAFAIRINQDQFSIV